MDPEQPALASGHQPEEWTPDRKYDRDVFTTFTDPATPYDPYRDLSLEPNTIPLVESTQTHRRSSSGIGLFSTGAWTRQGPSSSIILPALLVFAISAGFGAALLGWLVSHGTQDSVGQIYHEGAFLLDEGQEGNEARLTGLTIASAASSAIGIVAPIAMGLYAFVTARAWLAARDTELPTPLQYGMLLEMLSGGSITSLAEAGWYMSRGRQRRPRVPPLFVKVFVVGIATHILAYLVSGVDIWLHSVTATTAQQYPLSMDSTWRFSVGQNQCHPYIPPTPNTVRYACLLENTRGSWGYGIDALTPGMQVMANSSQDLQTITLSSYDDLAVVVDPNVPQTSSDVSNVSYTGATFGARASCSSVNHLCTNPTPTSYNITCSDVPSGFPPINLTAPDSDTANGLSPGVSKLGLLSANCDGCQYINASDVSHGHDSYAYGRAPPVNNYSLWMQLAWELTGSESFNGASTTVSDTAPESDIAYTTTGPRAHILAHCSLTFYNVTIRYENGNYSRVAEELSNTGLSDGLAGPTRMALYASRLLDDVQGVAFSGAHTDRVMAYLNQDLARLALGSAAYLTDQKEPVLDQQVLGTRALGRYPFWPAVIYIVLLWINAIVPLGIAGWTMMTRTSRIRVPGDQPATVSALELAKLRLTRPAALVAELVWHRSEEQSNQRVLSSVSTSVPGMFDEMEDGKGVRVGLHEADGQTLFGVWRRSPRSGDLDGKDNSDSE
ncbi:hypothetical protein DENSPDRAFT_843829 [Dentipellis sp. KUC8613]|nr:hypothetical protein DENSPDRAFT_843829 [Dentipellis sp. KUC8613]